MSFRLEHVHRQNTSFATPGECYRILATSDSLRAHLSDSYWCEAMEQVCEGKLEGVAVRYTGENLVMLQFRPATISPAGYRYPLFMSIPSEFIVPTAASTVTMASAASLHGSSGTVTNSSFRSVSSSATEDKKSPSSTRPTLPKLCVVCGRYNTPGMIPRPHGWKCKDCKGKKSTPRLRQEAEHLQFLLNK